MLKKLNDQLSKDEVRARNRRPGTLLCGSRSFQHKKSFLSLKAPAISCEMPISSNDSMTRDGDRDGIAGTGSSHSAGCRRLSYRSRDLLIGPCLSARNLLQRLPDPSLKSRRFHVQREVIPDFAPVEALEQTMDMFL